LYFVRMIKNKMKVEAAPAQVGSPLDVVINALEQNKWDHASEQARALLEAAPDMLAALKQIAEIAESGTVARHETGKRAWYANEETAKIARAAIAHTGGDK
jgi:hypothetical protein